jgi:hypothetical protein
MIEYEDGDSEELRNKIVERYIITADTAIDHLLLTLKPPNLPPQHGFNRGMKELGKLGFEATMKELDDNLIGMGAV